MLAITSVFVAAAVLTAGTPAPATQPAAAPPWQMVVVHPSLDRDNLYTCVLYVDEGVAVNEHLSFALVLHNAEGAKVGVANFPVPAPIEGRRMVQFSLDADLIKKSYVIFQVRSGTDEVEWVRVFPGREQTVRRVDGEVVREPIE